MTTETLGSYLADARRELQAEQRWQLKCSINEAEGLREMLTSGLHSADALKRYTTKREREQLARALALLDKVYDRVADDLDRNGEWQ